MNKLNMIAVAMTKTWLAGALFFLASGPLNAEVPAKINFQGRLVENGTPVNDQRNFIFGIYDALSGGSQVWASATQSVAVANGVFSVVLATGTPSNISSNTFTGARYVGVSVGGAALTPRQEMLSVPYALVSQSLAADALIKTSNIDAGALGPKVVASSIAVNAVSTASIQDAAVTFAKMAPNGCTVGEIIKRNAANSAWECATDAVGSGGVGGVSLAPSSPDIVDLANVSPSIYIDSAGSGDMIRLLAGGVDRFTVDNSGNAYIVGFSSAAKYYGDGSALTGVTGSDNLGNHIATTTLNMAGFDIVNAVSVTGSSFTATGLGLAAVRLGLAANVVISSEASAALGAGVNVSSNVYVVGFSSAAKYYGDGSALTGIVAADNLGNHIATTTLNMAGFNIVNAGSVTGSSFTATGLGLAAVRLSLADNVVISSETSALLGAGVNISSNVYVVGFSSAARYYGDGSALTGIIAQSDNLGNHIATTTLNMAGFNIVNAGSVTGSSFTATGLGVAAARLSLADNVVISSETDAAKGAGVNVSSNIYIVGFSSAAIYYGAEAAITGRVSAGYYQINGSTVVAVLPGTGSLGLGVDAGPANTGNYNLFVGSAAGQANTTGAGNIFLGYKAGYTVNTGTGNIIIGYDLDASAPAANNEINIGGVYKGSVSSGMATIPKFTVRAVTGDTAAAFGETITVNTAADVVVTLPAVTVADIGATITVIKLGTGKVTVAANGTPIADSAAAGTIYNNAFSPAYASLTLRLADASRWGVVSGDGAWITTAP